MLSQYQMGHSPFLLQHLRLAIALSLLLLLLCSCSSISLPPAFLTLLVLLFSACSLSALSELRRLRETDKPTSSEEVLSREEKAFRGEEKEEEEGGVVTKGGGDHSSERSASAPSSSSAIVGGLSKENALELSGSSEDSISDDESLIEIALPEGSYADVEDPNACFLQELHDADGLLSGFSPESAVLTQSGLMDLLSEINEEDNLIEIDIARGSIKCSRLGIKA